MATSYLYIVLAIIRYTYIMKKNISNIQDLQNWFVWKTPFVIVPILDFVTNCFLSWYKLFHIELTHMGSKNVSIHISCPFHWKSHCTSMWQYADDYELHTSGDEITLIHYHMKYGHMRPLLLTWINFIYPLRNFKDANVEFWEWISNFIPHFTGHVITYTRCDQS